MKPDAPGAPALILTCLAGEECVVHFEPWGSEHVLKRGDVFHVRTSALATGNVEVSYVRDGIAVGFSSNADVVVVDAAGNELTI